MIVVKDNPISEHYRDLCLPSWEEKGFKVNIFDAVTPETLDQYNELTFGKKVNKHNKVLDFTETEKAVWYSHYLLWKRCFDNNTPLIVCEHDIKLLAKLGNEVFKNDMACICHVKRNRKENTIIRHAGGAYFLTPKVAKNLVRVSNRIIDFNSDWWLHLNCDEYGKWLVGKSIHSVDPDIGVTVTHNK